jgi:predicted enzyme related to lactoylglutathione lyase
VLTSTHLLIYSDDAAATRAFLRDVVGWPSLEEPESGGWLIFQTGPSELGVHPTSQTWHGEAYSFPRHHSISLMCDNLESTIADLAGKGATFADEIQEFEFGRGIMLEVPAADSILLYQPTHPTAYDL